MRFFDHPIVCVVMLLVCSVEALLYSTVGNEFWTWVMAACACWWLYRVAVHIRQGSTS